MKYRVRLDALSGYWMVIDERGDVYNGYSEKEEAKRVASKLQLLYTQAIED